MRRRYEASAPQREQRAGLEDSGHRLIIQKHQQLQVAWQSGLLLSSQGVGSGEEVLSIIAHVHPDQPNINESGFAVVYARLAESALDGGDLAAVQTFLDAGFRISSDDPELISVRHTLDTAIRELEVAQ